MEEHDKVKIKGNAVLVFIALFVVGMTIYLEIVAIVNCSQKEEFNSIGGIVFLLLIIDLFHWIYIMAVLVWIDMGRKIELTKDGCEISLFCVKKFYGWDEYRVKRIERYSENGRIFGGAKYKTAYEEGAVFCRVPLKRPTDYRPEDYVGSLKKPCLFSTVSICFQNEKSKKWYNWGDEFYKVDKAEFLQKMEEWGIELEKPE